MEHDPAPCTAELVIAGCREGIFPMVDPDSGELHWYAPDPRAIIPLDQFHVPRSLERTIRSSRFEVEMDLDFNAVIETCAGSRGSEETWIDSRIHAAYLDLHHRGQAHSVEARREGALVAGLYGVAIGGAFFGESMFSDPHRGRDGSKVCLVRLVEHLLEQGFVLLDVQFTTPHLERFGCITIPRSDYLHRLEAALALEVQF
ncbi:MAG: leucyl/phenylalanyl-tRNA--protein transferase [Planctomycetota bacterium]|nr:leucyl/phenylalanyl-tRNA--protein transferase [Planctomycetota bacterium]